MCIVLDSVSISFFILLRRYFSSYNHSSNIFITKGIAIKIILIKYHPKKAH